MNKNLRKQLWMAFLIALGFVLSPILRVPGMAPMQHFINVIAAVTVGPVGAFIVALLINIMRMMFLAISPLAITGSVFGAALSGIFFVKIKKPWGAAVGEWIGTGIIGSLLSYPVMALIMGVPEIGWLTYVPGFLAGTLSGGLLGLFFVHIMAKKEFFKQMMEEVLK
ncbi:MAG: energy coupling factor transporter S component ThiW [Gallicola sp.]|nr:energy coupling factor transporter S component ThiW [Gallicola sp.]